MQESWPSHCFAACCLGWDWPGRVSTSEEKQPSGPHPSLLPTSPTASLAQEVPWGSRPPGCSSNSPHPPNLILPYFPLGQRGRGVGDGKQGHEAKGQKPQRLLVWGYGGEGRLGARWSRAGLAALPQAPAGSCCRWLPDQTDPRRAREPLEGNVPVFLLVKRKCADLTSREGFTALETS